MKKLLTTTALITALGFAPLFVSPAFAQPAMSTVTPVPHYNQAVASWKLVTGAKCYNIYYRRVKQTAWKHSVRCVPNNMWTYTIKGLNQSASYEYSVAALNYSGKEFSWTPVAPLIASPIMQ